MWENISNFVFEKSKITTIMRKKYFFAIIIVAFTMIFSVYGQENKTGVTRIKKTNKDVLATMNHDTLMKSKIKEYATFVLTTDIKKLSENEKKVVALLIDVAKIMDDIYWMQTWGNQNTLLAKIHNDNDRKFVMINYGPWDRLDNNKPFLGENYKKPLDAEGKIVPVRKPSQLEVADNVVENAEPIVSESVIENTDTAIALNSEKPLGANFYPKDMTKEEFAMYGNVNKTSPYTILRRNDNGVLQTIWYHQAYKEQLTKAADILRRAADLTTDKEFANYLKLRADALLTSKYQASDMAWMDMKKNHLDLVVGPIENYEDALFEYKTAFESFVLVKDMDWSLKLDKFIGQLPELQKVLPVSDPYKQEVPGTSSDLGVYDAVYYAGDCNAGSKTIAINLPNDETVQLAKGSRRIQLKNAMRAKFDNIMVPIANRLIDQSQIKNVKFEAFFNNVMFHEVAHGLGIKNTINGK